MSELENAGTPVVEAPQITTHDAFAMDLGDLKKAAFDAQPAQPQPQVQPQTSEPFTLEQGPDGVQVRLSPEYGGEVYKGKDLNELVAKLAKSKADTNAYVKQLKSQPAITQPNAMPQQFLDPAIQQQSPEEAQREAEKLLRDVVLTPEVKQQIFQEGLRTDPQASAVFQSHQEWTAQNMAFEFHKRCPDYVDLPEQRQALEQALGNLQHPATVDDVEKYWAFVTYKNPALRYVPPQSTPAARPAVMPTAGASATVSLQDAWTRPLDQLKRDAGL